MGHQEKQTSCEAACKAATLRGHRIVERGARQIRCQWNGRTHQSIPQHASESEIQHEEIHQETRLALAPWHAAIPRNSVDSGKLRPSGTGIQNGMHIQEHHHHFH
jgi:hypothetical protein